MTYLITKQNKKFNIYIPTIYGCETWGDGHYQESIEKKRKFWYITSWRYGGEWGNDITTNYKLKVVCETNSLYEVIRYLCEAKVSKEEFDTLLDSAQKQINDFITFEKLSYK